MASVIVLLVLGWDAWQTVREARMRSAALQPVSANSQVASGLAPMSERAGTLSPE